MKRNLCKSMLLIISAFMFITVITESGSAQTGFPDDGILAARGRRPVHSGQPSVVLSGGVFVDTWTEGDIDGIIRVYAQVVAPDGELQFPENPIVLSFGETHALNAQVAATSDGDALICWKEKVGDDPDSWNIRAQRLNAGGETLWQEGGRVLHQHRQNYLSSYEFLPDYEGGAFLVINNMTNPRSSRVYSLNEDGDPRQGWSDSGISIDTMYSQVVPIRDGGCWIIFRHDFLNRLLLDGSFRWDENIVIESFQGRMGKNFQGSDGMNLYFLFGHYQGNDFAYAVTVYDTSGQISASDLLCERQADNLMGVDEQLIITEDRRVYLIYSEYILAGDLVSVHEMPWVICYEPFNENRLPWGDIGIQLQNPGDLSLLSSSDAGMHYIDETLIIAEKNRRSRQIPNRVYTLNTDGEAAWDEQPTEFPVGVEIEPNDGGFTYSSSDQVWILSGVKGRTGCFSFDGDGELQTGEHPVWLIPGYRYYPGIVSGEVMENGNYSILGYSQEGLFAQKLAYDGELQYPFDGQLLDENWPTATTRGMQSGKVGSRQWVWQSVGETDGQLAVFDADQSCLFNRWIEFPGGNLNWRTESIIDSDPEHLLILGYRGVGNYNLTSIDMDGEEVASVSYSASGIYAIEYMENLGWVVISANDNSTEISLLNDDLGEIWDERIELMEDGAGSYLSHAIHELEDHIEIMRLRYDNDVDLYWMFRVVITLDGEFISRDSTQVFMTPSRNGMDQWSIYPVSNGTTWILGTDNISYNRVQGIDRDGRRLLGDDGFFMLCRYTKLLPTGDGGCWLFWDDLDSLRVLHLDPNGQPRDGIYPQNGLALYDRDEYSFYDAELDPATDRVWLALEHEFRVLNQRMPIELRVQVLGDEWVSAPGKDVITPPATCILYPAYPNPFNSATTIEYALPFASHVSLSLYNLVGQRIETLVNGRLQAGVHRAMLDAGEMASGLYFVKLKRSNQVFTQKILLIK